MRDKISTLRGCQKYCRHWQDTEKVSFAGWLGWNRAAKSPSSGGVNKWQAGNVWNVDPLWVDSAANGPTSRRSDQC